MKFLSTLFFALSMAFVLSCGHPADHDHADESAHSHDDAGHGDDDHSHGGDSHDHGDDHSHGDEAEHSHADDGGHSHGDDDHAHGDDAHDHDAHDHDGPERWAVTAIGEHYEIFAEADPLVAAEGSSWLVHVTTLEGYEALRFGQVDVVLTSGGREQVFKAGKAIRPGIYRLRSEIDTAGSYQLAFRVESMIGPETLDAGSVLVGSADEPGGLVETPFAPATEDEAVDFLKEEQWRTDFATGWVATGALAASVQGPAIVRPPAGGEIVLTAPVDGLAKASAGQWPYVGAAVERGQTLFTIVPRRTDGVTPAVLEAGIAALDAEIEATRGRLARLEALLDAEAISENEVATAKARLVGLEADAAARRRDLAAQQGGHEGPRGETSSALAVRAPFAGRVASVAISSGETVAAGATLARVVVEAPVWVEVRLAPTDAVRFDAAPSGLLIRAAGSQEILDVAAEGVRFVARHPEVDASGTVGVVFAVDQPPPVLVPGIRADVEVLLPEARAGVVIPRSALVDDSGVDVVYVQTGGESFERREVRVVARQADRLLVEGLAEGERLVLVGGVTIRRATLLESGGGGHGHVH